MPEGGTTGNLLYMSVPETLVQSLLADGHGLGIGISIPAGWREHRWKGLGTPDTALAATLAHCVKHGGVLHSVRELVAESSLEATALKALDLAAPCCSATTPCC